MDCESDYASDDEISYHYSDNSDEDDESIASDTNSEMDESSALVSVPVGAGGNDKETSRHSHGKGKRRKRHSNGEPCYNIHMRTQNDKSKICMVGTSEIEPIMNEKIERVAEILAIPSSAAVPLLRHHKWDKDRLFDSYTTNSERELRDAGVYHRCIKRFKSDSSIEDVSSSNNQNLNGNQQSQEQILKDCTICYDEKPQEEMLSMPCGHEFCLECWKSQIQITLESGPSCILATCPAEKCNEIVTEEEVSKVAQELLPKFTKYQLRNFVELNGTSRWCPGPGCDRIAAMTGKNSSLSDANSIVATCDVCSTIFCIKCGAEPHAPLICSVLDTWNEKCKNESETANWLLANTKKCPNCNTRIEKNQGCNHMTCRQCKHEFCWICTGDWSKHGRGTGGYYNCNKFQMDEEAKVPKTDVDKAKRELERYLHYYTRFDIHDKAQKFACKQLQDIGKKMSAYQECRNDATWADVEFLKTANEQIVECRRVLKFTYVYAYYMTTPLTTNTENKDESKSSHKKSDTPTKEQPQLLTEEQKKETQKDAFESHQGRLEEFTEGLSDMVEKPFNEIDRTGVVNKTRVVKKYIENILEYVEDGM
mmetsp:Transcript_6870/g.8675  ORF Transcript_6870/g.8675 Transcript_6870/m.8675 type:complete len:594 (-) Transcript_6870:266-2047(-)